MMGSFLRTGVVSKRAPGPVLELYELGQHNPCYTIDSLGQLWVNAVGEFDVERFAPSMVSNEEIQRRSPKVVFGDVPVIIHTVFGFSIAPMKDANEQTGPSR